MDDTRKQALNKLENAIEQFEVFKSSQDNFLTKEKLQLVCIIRDNVVNDEEIRESCECEPLLATKRKELLEAIKSYIDGLISEVTAMSIDLEGKCEYLIKDFGTAKAELSQIVKKEMDVFLTCPELQPDGEFIIPDSSVHLDTIDKVIENCNNNRYEILLMGEYQTGKTTTLNAFCGGLDIGAMGNGTKTSAVPLVVSYNEKRTTTIVWKSEQELLVTFSHIAGYIPSFSLKEFKLSDRTQCNELLVYLENLRTNKSLDKIGESDIQFVALCSLIVKYYGTTLYEQYRNKKYSLEEVARLSRFPENFIKNWGKNGPAAFTIEDILFVFIKQIECGCPSPLLKEMKSAIKDCPGLFASAYDTSVTELAMMDADAILYILPKEKQAGKQIDDSLLKIKNLYSDVKNKLLIANNLSLIDVNSKAIFESNTYSINRLFDNKVKVLPYDALMAYLGEVKLSYDNLRLDKKTIRNFIASAQKPQFSPLITGFAPIPVIDGFDDAWNQRTRVYSGVFGKKLSAEDLISIGGFNSLTEGVKEFVEKNKAYSTIIARGADKLLKELKSIRVSLYQLYVEPYLKDRNSLEQQWNNRVLISKTFEEEAKTIVEDTLFKPKNSSSLSLCDELSNNIYDKLFPSDVYDSMIEDICDSIFDNVKEIKKLKDKKPELERYLTGLVTECISSQIKKRIDYWNSLIVSDQDTDFNKLFLPQVEIMEGKLDRKWEKLYDKDGSFAQMRRKYFYVPKSTKSFCIEEQQQKSSVSVNNKDINVAVALNYASIATFIASCVAAYAIYLAVCVGAGPIGWLIAAVGSVLGGILGGGKIDEYNRKNFHKKMKPELSTQIYNSDLQSKLNEMIHSQVSCLLNRYTELLTLDSEHITRDKDIALASLDNPARETNCFSAIGAIEQIDKQAQQYSTFMDRFKDNVTS